MIGRRIKVSRSLAYGEGARRTLDVYWRGGAGPAPVILFFYGGSWQGGSKRLYRFVGTALARRGYVAVVADYRTYPEVRFPGFIEDGALALRWTKDHAMRFGGDPHRIFLMGHSAGAHIAAMLALDGQWLNDIGLDNRRDIAGLIGIAGPYDFLPLRDGVLKTIFSGNDPRTQPISHVSHGAPPALLVTGAHDNIVDPGNSARLAAKLESSSNEAKVITYPRGLLWS